jgi:hypothetical protein
MAQEILSIDQIESVRPTPLPRTALIRKTFHIPSFTEAGALFVTKPFHIPNSGPFEKFA